MKQPKQRIIDGKWEVLEPFGRTGQGQSSKVTRVGGDGTIYVIKELKQRSDSHNGASRFKQEIELLKALEDIERIPSIVDDNMSQNYYVMDYIEGVNLQYVRNDGNRKGSFDEIMTAMMQLLNIVDDYSRRGIVHRDIKPANIICKNGHIDDLYLVDFGIAFNRKDEQELTTINEHLGNRFLDLPELKIGNKRDIRSDLTSCVGILFYMLTDSNPTVLINAEEKMPHQTEKGIMRLQWVGSRNLRILYEVFDKGFQVNIEERFQTVSDLIFALNKINLQNVAEKNLNGIKRTDSFCWETIKTIMNEAYGEDVLLRLSLYNNQMIALGNVFFLDDDEKVFVKLKGEHLIYSLNKSPRCQCQWEGGFYGNAQKIKNARVMNSDDSFELFGKIHINGTKVSFDNVMLQNYMLSLQLMKLFECRGNLEFERCIVDVIEAERNIVFICDSSYIVYDNLTERTTEVDLAYLNGEKGSYKLSRNLQWVVYIKDRKTCIARLRENRYEIRSFDDAELSLNDNKSYTLLDDELILLKRDRLLKMSLESGDISELYSIRQGILCLDQLKDIQYVSPNGTYISLINGQGRKICINNNMDKYHRRSRFADSERIINTTSEEFVYTYLRYDNRVIRQRIADGMKEVLWDRHERLGYGAIEWSSILFCDQEYFFALENIKDRRRAKDVNQISVYKIIDGCLTLICSIGCGRNIVNFWVQTDNIIAIDDENCVIIWKKNYAGMAQGKNFTTEPDGGICSKKHGRNIYK